jgi:hypothetical protein
MYSSFSTFFDQMLAFLTKYYDMVCSYVFDAFSSHLSLLELVISFSFIMLVCGIIGYIVQMCILSCCYLYNCDTVSDYSEINGTDDNGPDIVSSKKMTKNWANHSEINSGPLTRLRCKKYNISV